MIYRFTCRGAGIDCDFAAYSENIEEVVAEAMIHAKREHGIA